MVVTISSWLPISGMMIQNIENRDHSVPYGV